MLSTIYCPKCKKPMRLLFDSSTAPNKYEDCARRCENCGVGASNSTIETPTFIYRNYKDNIPERLLTGLDFTLKNSLNIYNRDNKKRKIGYSTSEDALTWIFFSYFVTESKLSILQALLDLKNPIEEILLWGVPIIDFLHLDYTNKLKTACLKFGEDVNKLSEPDCIIISNHEVMFIEVKFYSENPKLEGEALKKFEKYFANDSYSDYCRATSSGLYELVRNWTIGDEFSKGKDFYLMNLGKQKLFSQNKKIYLDQFRESLINPSKFICKSWESIIGRIEFLSLDSWFVDEIQKRFSK